MPYVCGIPYGCGMRCGVIIGCGVRYVYVVVMWQWCGMRYDAYLIPYCVPHPTHDTADWLTVKRNGLCATSQQTRMLPATNGDRSMQDATAINSVLTLQLGYRLLSTRDTAKRQKEGPTVWGAPKYAGSTTSDLCGKPQGGQGGKSTFIHVDVAAYCASRS